MSLEQKYIEDLKAGSYQAFTFLYEMYAGKLYTFVISLTDSNVLAKDIVQETFIKVWIYKERVDEAQSFKNYLFTIARNQLLNELRKKINQSVPLDALHSLTPLDDSEDMEVRDLDEEMLEKVQQAKLKLPPRQLQLFEMSKEQELPISEIIRITKLSEQSIRNQLSLAIKTLRKEIKLLF